MCLHVVSFHCAQWGSKPRPSRGSVSSCPRLGPGPTVPHAPWVLTAPDEREDPRPVLWCHHRALGGGTVLTPAAPFLTLSPLPARLARPRTPRPLQAASQLLAPTRGPQTSADCMPPGAPRAGVWQSLSWEAPQVCTELRGTEQPGVAGRAGVSAPVCARGPWPLCQRTGPRLCG